MFISQNRVFPWSLNLKDQCPSHETASEGRSGNTVDTLGDIYFSKEEYLRISNDIFPSLCSFGGQWSSKGIKMHIFVHQGKPCQNRVNN